MSSLAFIVGGVLTGKENYPKWYKKIKAAFIYNDMWKGICEGDTIKIEGE